MFREANMVADGFTRLARSIDASMEFHELIEVPRDIQKLFFSDRIDIHYYRPKCN